MIKIKIIKLIRALLPKSTRRVLIRLFRWPPIGSARRQILNNITPISRNWGGDRGLPIDRYYIEKFLAECAGDVRGHILEFSDNHYSMRYGGNRVIKSDILAKEEGNQKANIVVDITHADHLPSNVYDCILCTQTLQFIYDIRAALTTLYRLLKPGGVLLVTIPTISMVSKHAVELWGDYWRFTSMSSRLLFNEIFPPDQVVIKAYGNVLVATAFLYGLATEELDSTELEFNDPEYEFLITVRASKPWQ